MKNPLDKRRKQLADGNRGTFQYFLKVRPDPCQFVYTDSDRRRSMTIPVYQVVPTEYTYLSADRIVTNQFSATEHFRKLTPVSDKGLPSEFGGCIYSDVGSALIVIFVGQWCRSRTRSRRSCSASKSTARDCCSSSPASAPSSVAFSRYVHLLKWLYWRVNL